MGIIFIWFGFFTVWDAQDKSNAIETILYLFTMMTAIVGLASLTSIKIDDGTLKYLALPPRHPSPPPPRAEAKR